MVSALACPQKVGGEYLQGEGQRVARGFAYRARFLQTIKSNDQISELFKNGKRESNRYLTFIYIPSKLKTSEHDQQGRVAFIAGRKLGNAVWRNSAKRRLREIYREIDGSWKNNDILIVARKPLLEDSYSKVLEATRKTISRID